MTQQASQICLEPDNEARKVAAEVKAISDHTESYAYRFVRCKDGSLYEVRVIRESPSPIFTPVDEKGVPIGAPVALEPPQPVQVGSTFTQPTPPAEESKKRPWWRRLLGLK